jgi:hypothetical protein
VTRLPKGSRLCLLNPRDVFRALAGTSVLIPQVSLHLPFALPGLVRAARDMDSVLSVAGAAARRALGHELQVPQPYAQFEALAAAASTSRRPLMLVGTLPLDATDERSVATAKEIVFRFVDAGFTGLALRPMDEPADTIARLVSDVAGPIRERELTLEVGMPSDSNLDRLTGIAQAVRDRGFMLDAVTVTLDDHTSPDEIEQLSRALSPAILAARGTTGAGKLRSLANAGLRRLDLSRPLFDVIARFLPESLVREVRSQPHLGPALAAHAPQFEEAIPADLRERIEALAYGEMLDLVRALRAGGSATTAAKFLSTRSGY